MAALELLLFMLRILPISEVEDYDRAILYRMEIAEACVNATEDRTERYICAKIPRFESNFREDVGRCAIKGPQGELSAWQILPRNRTERARLCTTVEEDAILAVERIRESTSACKHLPKSEQLSLYTRGSCTSVEGRKLSKHRWPYERRGEVY